jgi:hypothetical protein
MKINQKKGLVHALIGSFASIERVVTTEYEGLRGQTCILGAYMHSCVCVKRMKHVARSLSRRNGEGPEESRPAPPLQLLKSTLQPQCLNSYWHKNPSFWSSDCVVFCVCLPSHAGL